jgi:erythromycin esterase-like protein
MADTFPYSFWAWIFTVCTDQWMRWLNIWWMLEKFTWPNKLIVTNYSTLDNFCPEPANYGKAVVPNQVENVAKVLTELYKHKNWLYQIPGNGQELFNFIENAHMVAAAEAYYHQMYNGNVWNLCDSTFLDAVHDVIAYLKQQKTTNSVIDEPVQIIIWAHNLHVGDASAT